MSLADTNLGSMTATIIAPPTTQSKVEGLTETKAETPPTKEMPKQEQQQHRGFDVLARKERALLHEKQKLASEREAILQERAQVTKERAEYIAYLENKSKYKTNPKQLLADHGLTYQELAEYQLNDGEPTPALMIKQQQERIDNLEKMLADKEAKREAVQQEQQKQYEQQVLSDFREQIDTFVKSRPDTYEYIQVNDAQNLVYDTVEEYYSKTGEILPIKKAADMVEQHLTNIVESKILASKKLQAKIGRPAQPTTIESKPTRTLSNQITTTSAPTMGITAHNEADRLKRAMAKLEGR